MPQQLLDATPNPRGAKAVKCPLCEGNGYVPTGAPFDPGEPERCADCNGQGTIRRNFLSEALLIANGRLSVQPEKDHIIAIVEFSREFVSTALQFPSVKEAA